MFKEYRVLCVIPARSGSKGLLDKNIKLLAGKPLITYSIDAAKKAGLFDKIHVSTDSMHYSDIASEYGSSQDFLRDSENSGDLSSSWDAVREVICKYEAIGEEFDLCALLQPTSPLRTSDDIVSAFNLFFEKNARSVVSVTEVDHPVQWCFKLDKSQSMSFFNNCKYKNSRRQDLEKYYRENGAIYIVRTSDLMNPDFDFYNNDCYALIMEKEKSIDIDTEFDFLIAESIIRKNRGGQ